MLNQMRSVSANFLAKLLLALLILSFAVWGIGDMARAPTHNAAVAEVGNSTITVSRFQQAYQREIEAMRRALGNNFSPELAKSLNLPQQVMQHLIQQELLRQESTAIGLVPGDAEVARRIRTNPAFQNGKGDFDKPGFLAALRRTGLSEKQYADQLRGEIAVSMLQKTLTSAVPVSDTAAKILLAALEQKRSGRLYVFGGAQMAPLPAPTAEELEAYYKEHIGEFTVPEFRKASYVVIRPENIKHQAVAPQAEVQRAYQERLDEFRRPERRTVKQLLYASEDKAREAYRLLKGGRSFESVAAETRVMNKDALSLGEVERGRIMEAAADAVFALPKGGVTEPVKSHFGWHVFHVTAIRPPSVQSLDEVRAMLEKDWLEHENAERMTRLANTLEDALAGGATLEEASRDLELKIQTAGPVSRDGKAPGGHDATLPPLDRFLDTLFKTAGKAESPLIAVKGGSSYLLRVDEIAPEHPRPLEEVRARVAEGWKKQERDKRLYAAATEAAAKLAEGKSPRPAASAFTLARDDKRIGDHALPAELAAEIFERAPGKPTGAYRDAASGDYLVAVVEKILPATPREGSALDETRRQLQEVTQTEMFAQYLTHLAKKHKVSVHTELMETALE